MNYQLAQRSFVSIIRRVSSAKKNYYGTSCSTSTLAFKFHGQNQDQYHTRGHLSRKKDSILIAKQFGPFSGRMQARRSISSSRISAKQINPFLLADIGEGIAEVEMMQWFVSEGESVKQFDRICEVQSDKATVEITSRYDGVVSKVHHEVGDMVKVGDALIDIEVEGDENESPGVGGSGESPEPSKTVLSSHVAQDEQITMPDKKIKISSDSNPNATILTTPAVRRIAKENDIDLSYVTPTGPKGRILKADVLDYIKHGGNVVASGHYQTTHHVTNIPPLSPHASNDDDSFTPAPTNPNIAQSGSVLRPTAPTVVPVRGMMRLMVKSMNESLKVPHFGYKDEIIMDNLTDVRNLMKPIAMERGIKLSYMPFLLKACSLALLQYPIINSSLSADEKEVIMHHDHNLGIAMDTPKGLLVPVIKYCQQKSIYEIAMELNQLQVIGSEGKLAGEHLEGCTMSLSNIGSIGGTYMHPVIVPPQVAIGAVGSVKAVPRYTDASLTKVEPTRVMNISWSGDHRVIDGATMARFSNLMKQYIENPSTMVGDMR